MRMRTVSKCALSSTDYSRRMRRLSMESLEDRRQLSVTGTSNVALVNDTGASNTDRYTSDPTITGNYASGSSAVQVMDNNGVVGTATLSNGTFTYNPLAFDSALQNWQGALDLQSRIVVYNGYGGIVSSSAWNNFNLTLDRVAPSTSGIANVQVNENATPTSINLASDFTDGGTPSGSLAFQVVGNSNPSLFSSVGVSGGTLTLAYAPNQSGNASITVKVTDLAGNSTTATFTDTVDWVDQAPVISNFQMTNEAGNYWTISGTVTDDTNPTGYVVNFGGVLAGYGYTATVDSDGTFSVVEEIDNLQVGMATAQTTDPQGLVSNTAMYWVS